MGCLIVRFIVTALSHPSALVKFAICVPAVLNVKPFHVKGNDGGHIDESSVFVVGCLIIKLNTAVESHPAALVNIFV